MGLKCSVLGHSFGDATVERDREEQGSEVVITIREIETCSRCAEERIVSENKEVTTLATPDEPTEPGDGRDDEGARERDAESEATESADDGDVSPDGVTESVDQPATEDPVGESEPAVEESEPIVGESEPTVGESIPADANEGVEILEAEADADEEAADDELADPSIEGPPLGGDPVEEEPVEEDAVIIDGDDEDDDGDDDGGREPGAWPEEPDTEPEEQWTPDEALEDETPITAPDAGTENNAAVTIPDGQFRCPQCGYTTLVEDSSLRAGDFCPDCRKGSLVHEPRDETRKE